MCCVAAIYEPKKLANLQMLVTESNYENTSMKCNKRLRADFISFTCRSFHLCESTVLITYLIVYSDGLLPSSSEM